ncbi:MAG: polysaccharide deacetylase, partial [Candidatus Methanofastidiosa archaeon]|nr:polysaccharide deacetylase [Candidatus Methanofastidiosa archaeon]
MNGELPNGWVWTSLGNVCNTITSGNPAPQGKDFFENGKYPFVRVQDMGQLGNNVYIHGTKDYINEKASIKMKLFPKGSVL